MNWELRILALVGVAIAGTIAYGVWHHKVFQEGYDKRVGEEKQTVVNAQPTIIEGESQYAELVKKIMETPAATCDVGPATSLVLDSLR